MQFFRQSKAPKSGSQDPLNVDGPVLDRDDYTFFIKGGQFEELVEQRKNQIGGQAGQIHSAIEADLKVRNPNRPTRSIVGRAVICRCFAQTMASVTIRVNEKSKDGYDNEPVHASNSRPFEESPYKPKTDKEKYRCLTADAICSTLFQAIFKTGPKVMPAQGLVLVTGRTGSMKSTVVRGLIHKYLAELSKTQERRRLHLLTHEDPIEKPFFPKGIECESLSPLIDYTPRDFPSGDTDGLRTTFQNALRQTPAAVYLGEIRDKKDWRHVVDFAGTGHLIFTTAHAGSLTETLQKLFSFVKADTPSRRGQIADSLHAVVHLSAFKFDFTLSGETKPTVFETVIPTLWRRTRMGTATLVADGLGAIVPNRPTKAAEAEFSSFGKAWFADQMKKYVNPLALVDSGDAPKLGKKLLDECIRRDLEGI